MKVRVQTRNRLELVHRTMVPLAIMGLVFAGACIFTFLSADGGWKGYTALVIGLVFGLGMVLMACNSTVDFDRSRGYLTSRHRFFHGRCTTKRTPLKAISAVVLVRDLMYGNVLTVICARIDGVDLPITMFGTPFPAAAYKHAVRISAFLELPLVERDRLVGDTVDAKVKDSAADFVGSRALSPGTYKLLKKAHAKSYTGWIQVLAVVAFFSYLVVERDTTTQIFGLDSTSWWPFILLLLGMHFAAQMGMNVSSLLCWRRLRIVYMNDRESFALAGGFDVGFWPPLIAQVGLFAAYWWSWNSPTDPLSLVRGPWAFIIISTVVGLALTAVTANIVFGRQADRNHMRSTRRRVTHG